MKSTPVPDNAVMKIRRVLDSVLGDTLSGLYLFPTVGERYLLPDVADWRLLAIGDKDVDIHKLRAAFLPLWNEIKEELVQPPLFTRQESLQRHLRLHPLLNRHLQQTATLVAGQPISFPQIEVEPQKRIAYLSHRAMRASTVLGADLLRPQQVAVAQRRLHQLATALGIDSLRLSGDECFVMCQKALQQQVPRLPSTAVAAAHSMESSDHAYGSGVSAIYEQTDRLVVVMKRAEFDLLNDLNWLTIGQHLRKIGGTFYLTTEEQLHYLLSFEVPLDLALQRYKHVAGDDPLATYTYSLPRILEHAARIPSQLLIYEATTAYLIAGDTEAIHQVIHDFQNRLLNIRLQHELLHRLHQLPAAAPPPLPGRDHSLPVRVDAILDQFSWWVEHYLVALNAQLDT